MTVMAYQTQDGLAHYGFSIEFLPDAGWRIYIVFLPGRQGAEENPRLPYRSIDRTGRAYVNWRARIDSLGEAKVVAALWAELTRYDQAATVETPHTAPNLTIDAA